MRTRAFFLLVAATMSLAIPAPSGASAARPDVASLAAMGCAIAPASSAGSTAPPLVSANCPGIRPGAAMTSPAGCTMNFVFRNGATGTDRYIGTAAHCVGAVGQAVHMAGEGHVGNVVWSGWLDTGNGTKPAIDFALVKINASKLSRVNPQMCHWGGPTAMLASPPTFPTAIQVVHYGHGIGAGSITQTKARQGVAYGWAERQFWFFGAVTFGDSGSPVMTADGRAAGVAVRISAFDNVASRVDDGIRMASATLGVDLQLVTAPLV